MFFRVPATATHTLVNGNDEPVLDWLKRAIKNSGVDAYASTFSNGSHFIDIRIDSDEQLGVFSVFAPCEYSFGRVEYDRRHDQ